MNPLNGSAPTNFISVYEPRQKSESRAIYLWHLRPRLLLTIDAYSECAFPLRLYFETTALGHGTGFLWRADDGLLLFTNWHVVTGRNPTTLKHADEKTAAEPSRAEVSLWRNNGIERVINLRLYAQNGSPTWYVHPEFGREVDLVAIPIPRLSDAVTARAVNDLPQVPLRTVVGSQLFILGYPFLPERYPVWKQATVASEPALTPSLRRHLLVDSASRPGMSGAPVIQRAAGLLQVEHEGSWRAETHALPITRFVGVYSGRLNTRSILDAQLGMVWPAQLVSEIAEGRRRDIHPQRQRLYIGRLA